MIIIILKGIFDLNLDKNPYTSARAGERNSGSGLQRRELWWVKSGSLGGGCGLGLGRAKIPQLCGSETLNRKQNLKKQITQ